MGYADPGSLKIIVAIAEKVKHFKFNSCFKTASYTNPGWLGLPFGSALEWEEISITIAPFQSASYKLEVVMDALQRFSF